MSVRGERIIYRERERDRESNYDEPQRRTYTTVKRYQVPDRDADSRTTIFDSNDNREEDKIVIRRERRQEAPPRSPRSEVDLRVTERVVERSRDRDHDHGRRDDIDWRVTERVAERDRGEPARRDIAYRVIERDSDHDRHAGLRGDFRVVERDREIMRAPSPPVEERVREFRFEREREYSPSRVAREDRPYDLERYSKNTEYYAQPQPIIIREAAPQPIIIREERREPQQIVIRRDEPQYEIIEREEVREDRQLVRKEELPPPAPSTTNKSVVKSSVKSAVQKPQDEDYFYERRIREVDRGPRRRDDEIKPSDSASQYSSDDSYEYVRRERYVEEERDGSPHHKRHLAEGALAGAAAGAIIRRHRKSQGQEAGHRGRDLLGGAALGAIGAEAISRARSLRASSRRRSWDEEDDDRPRRRKHKSRSRSRSKSRVRQLGGLAAVAAVGALAGYALKNRGNNKETVIINDPPPRRSRSRRRHASVDTGYTQDERRRSEDTAQDPNHRNRRIAQAGLASAAAAGIWQRMRSKSRPGRERSKSRIRTAAPIVGASLGGAALAGLYERNKASKEAKREAIVEDELNRGRGRHSRSRSRSAPAPHPGDGRRRPDDRGLIAYGADPIYPDQARGGAQHDYYSDEEPGNYRRRHHHGSSNGSSPDTRRRSRSRRRGLAEAGVAAAGGAALGHEIGRRNERNRNERERGHDEYDDRYSDDYDRHAGYITPPPQEAAFQQNQHGTYPNSNYFPPPPTGDNAYREPAHAGAPGQETYNPYPTYNPADYPPVTGGAPHEPYPATHGGYGTSDATLGAPHPNDTFAGDTRYGDPAEASAARERQEDREERERRGRDARNDPGNVSTYATTDDSVQAVREREGRVDGVNQHPPDETNEPSRNDSTTPRARSTSRVRFDLNSNVAHFPERTRHRRRQSADDSGAEPRHRHKHHDESERPSRRTRNKRPRSTPMNNEHERAADSDSDNTVELPARFDESGNRKPDGGNDGGLAARLGELFGGGHGGNEHGDGSRGRDDGGAAGSGALGDVLRNLAGELFRGDDDGGRSGRRTRRQG